MEIGYFIFFWLLLFVNIFKIDASSLAGLIGTTFEVIALLESGFLLQNKVPNSSYEAKLI